MRSYQEIKKIVIIDRNPVNEEITTIRSENNSDEKIKSIFDQIKLNGKENEESDYEIESYNVSYTYIKPYIGDYANEPRAEEIIAKIVYE